MAFDPGPDDICPPPLWLCHALDRLFRPRIARPIAPGVRYEAAILLKSVESDDLPLPRLSRLLGKTVEVQWRSTDGRVVTLHALAGGRARVARGTPADPSSCGYREGVGTIRVAILREAIEWAFPGTMMTVDVEELTR